MAIRVPPDSRLPRELGAYRHGVAVRRALAAHRARVARERRRLIRERSGARSKMGDTALDVLGRVRVALLEPVHAVVIGTRLVGHGAQALRFLFRRASASVTAPEEFLVTGHRGSPAVEVENTLPSFERALAEGANALELDLCVTADDAVVVWHDWDPDSNVSILRQVGLERNVRCKPFAPPLFSPGRRPVRDLDLDELRAGHGWLERLGGGAVDARIPTFDEVCAWAKGVEGLDLIFLDTKIPEDSGEIPTLVHLLTSSVRASLEAHGARFDVVYLTPYENVLQELKATGAVVGRSLDVVVPTGFVLCPSKYGAIPKAIGHRAPCATSGRPAFALAGWSVYRGIVRDDLALRTRHNAAYPDRAVHRLVCWTIDDEDELRTLHAAGVQGILTDFPALLRAIADGTSAPPA